MNDESRIYILLEIAEKAAAHGGKLAALGSWATDELLAINAQMKAAARAKAEVPVEPQEPGLAQPAFEDDHSVDLNFGAPSASPAAEVGGNLNVNTRRL